MNNSKKKKTLRLLLLALLIAIILFLTFFFASYLISKNAALKGNFQKAEDFLFFKSFVKFFDPELTYFINLGIYLENITKKYSHDISMSTEAINNTLSLLNSEYLNHLKASFEEPLKNIGIDFNTLFLSP